MPRIAHLVAGSLGGLITLGAMAAGGVDGTLRFGNHTIDDKGVVTTEILWTSNRFLAGFQFDILGADITNAGGGITEDLDWLVDHLASRVLGVDISGTRLIEPSSTVEVLLELKLVPEPDATEIRFEGVVFSAPGGVAIPVDSDDVLMLGEDDCPADLNRDGRVDGEDMGLFLVAWGTDAQAADLNGNGVVDGPDLGLILAAWDFCP